MNATAQFLSRQRATVAGLVLALVTTALYWSITHHDFFNIDDPRFITQNPQVQAGLTRAGILWSFQTFDTENWQPLTWMSHMLDCQMYGLHAGGHHLTNLLFHVANSLLLFLWLNGLTRATWRSAFVAAFFAWHPLHVESVAWACERKDVLSTFFWLLALLAYTGYARNRPVSAAATATASSATPGRRTFFYALTLVFFACGLMSKPMVVTLPCVLLLLDFWPLDRFGIFRGDNASGRNLARRTFWIVAEKIPFALLTVTMSVATLFAQKAGGALSSLSGMPLGTRVVNSVVNYAIYLGKTFSPTDLAYFYPYQHTWPTGLIAGAVLLLLLCSGWFAWRVRSEPYLLVGWLWFVGTLVPTVGLVHVGIQSRADRYMYIPSIGLFIVVVWGIDSLCARRPAGKLLSPVLGALALAACLAVTSVQLGYWQNSLTLSQHAIDVTRDNYVAYESLGRALEENGQKEQALACYVKSVAMEPEFPQSQFNLGRLLRDFGHVPEAAEHFEAAAKLVPKSFDTRMALGQTLMLLNTDQWNEATAQFTEALRLKPDSSAAHRSLAVALAREGQVTNALPHFTEAVRLDPTNADLRFALGLALLDTHQPAAAAAQFRAELQLTPDETKAHFRLAQALQQQGQFADAAAHYQAALRLTPNFPEAQAALGEILSAHPELKSREPLDIAH
jgi:tetratricopeptide (TPR) repeat protein